MSVIDTSNWKKFVIGKLFKVTRGKRLIEEDRENGMVFYFSASQSNNGLTDKISNPLFIVKDSLIYTTFGDCFYVEGEFTASDEISILKNENLNKYSGLFIATVINKNKYKYAFGRKAFQNKFLDEIINLPVKINNNGSNLIDSERKYSDEGYIPDWEYMESYMKQIENIKDGKDDKLIDKLTTANKSKSVRIYDKNKWKEFYLHKLFNTSMGNGIDAIATTNDNPKYNYVSRDSNGNGVVGFVDEVEGQKPFPAGAMSLALGGSFLGSCFIQKEPFYTAQNVGILQEKEPLSIHTKLFISTLIRNKCKIKYQAFGRELNSHFRKDFTLKLPVLMNGNDYVFDKNKKYSDKGYIPDWKFMENYIKSLPYGDRIDDFREDVSYEY